MAAILANFFVALLSTWLNIESSYLAQLCTYTGATHSAKIMPLSIIFLKLQIFLKIHILHFLAHLCTALPVTALIIETSYLANICSYTPSICT